MGKQSQPPLSADNIYKNMEVRTNVTKINTLAGNLGVRNQSSMFFSGGVEAAHDPANLRSNYYKPTYNNYVYSGGINRPGNYNDSVIHTMASGATQVERFPISVPRWRPKNGTYKIKDLSRISDLINSLFSAHYGSQTGIKQETIIIFCSIWMILTKNCEQRIHFSLSGYGFDLTYYDVDSCEELQVEMWSVLIKYEGWTQESANSWTMQTNAIYKENPTLALWGSYLLFIMIGKVMNAQNITYLDKRWHALKSSYGWALTEMPAVQHVAWIKATAYHDTMSTLHNFRIVWFTEMAGLAKGETFMRRSFELGLSNLMGAEMNYLNVTIDIFCDKFPSLLTIEIFKMQERCLYDAMACLRTVSLFDRPYIKFLLPVELLYPLARQDILILSYAAVEINKLFSKTWENFHFNYKFGPCVDEAVALAKARIEALSAVGAWDLSRAPHDGSDPIRQDILYKRLANSTYNDGLPAPLMTRAVNEVDEQRQ